MHLKKCFNKHFNIATTGLLALLLTSCGSTLKTTSSVQKSANYNASVKNNPLITADTLAKSNVSLLESEEHCKIHQNKDLNYNVPISSYTLYTFVNDWLNTPYQYAGKSKSGVDCSDFTCILYKNVYNINISGSSRSLFESAQPVKRKDLVAGDLVFFKIKRGQISHVGVYLNDDKFVHASLQLGVIISNLNEDYYKKHFYMGGRLKSLNYKCN